MHEGETAVRDLLIERAARRFGFERIATAIGRPGAAPYLLVATVLVVHIPILSAVGWLQTGTLSMAENPGEVFQIPAWLAVVWLMRRLKRRYDRTIDDLPTTVDEDLATFDPEGPVSRRVATALGVPRDGRTKSTVGIDSIIADRVVAGLVVLGWVAYGTQLATDPSSLVGPVVELTGPVVATIRFYVIIPLALYPIGGELLGLVAGVLVVLPLKIRRARLIDFSDPHGTAGLAPVGQLFKSIVVSYFLLLALFTTFQTVAVGTSPTALFSSSLIIGGLVVGLVLFAGPLLWLREFISTAKEHKIDAIARRTAEVGSTDERVPYADPESPAETSRYLYEQLRMERVDRTSELPLETGMIREVLFALVLPYATSLAFDYVLNTAM